MKLTAIGLATVIALAGAVPILAVQASDHIPSFHAERTCKAVKQDSDEAYKDCLRPRRPPHLGERRPSRTTQRHDSGGRASLLLFVLAAEDKRDPAAS
jgi:hypothetical protein